MLCNGLLRLSLRNALRILDQPVKNVRLLSDQASTIPFKLESDKLPKGVLNEKPKYVVVTEIKANLFSNINPKKLAEILSHITAQEKRILRPEDKKIMLALTRRILDKKRQEFSASQVASILHSLSRFDIVDNEEITSELWALVIEKPRLRKLEPPDLLLLVETLAVQKNCDGDRVVRVCKSILNHAPEFMPKYMSKLLLALSKVAVHDKPTIVHLCNQIRPEVMRLDGEHLANILGGVANLPVHADALVRDTCDAMLEKRVNMNHLSLLLVLDGLWKLRVSDRGIIDFVCDQLRMRVTRYTTGPMASQVLTALAHLAVRDEGITTGMCRVIIDEGILHNNPADTLSILVALGRLQLDNQELVEQVCASAVVKMDAFSPSELTSLLRALVTLRVNDPLIINPICQSALAIVDRFLPKEATSTLHALALLGFKHEELGQRLEAIAKLP